MPEAIPHQPTQQERRLRRAQLRKNTFLADTDGRLVAARRFRTGLAQIISDLGGDPSTGQRMLARRIAMLDTAAEQIEAQAISGARFEHETYCSVVNTLNRLLAAIGLERRQRDVTTNPTFADIRRELDANQDAEA